MFFCALSLSTKDTITHFVQFVNEKTQGDFLIALRFSVRKQHTYLMKEVKTRKQLLFTIIL